MAEEITALWQEAEQHLRAFEQLAAALHKLATAKDGDEALYAQEAIDAALPPWTQDSRPASGAIPSRSLARIAQLVAAVHKGPDDPDALAAVERIRHLAAEAVRMTPSVTTDWDFTVGKANPSWLIPDWIPATGVGLLTSEDASGLPLLALQLLLVGSEQHELLLGRRQCRLAIISSSASASAARQAACNARSTVPERSKTALRAPPGGSVQPASYRVQARL